MAGASVPGRLGAHNLFILGAHNLFVLGTHNLFILGVHNLFKLGAHTLFIHAGGTSVGGGAVGTPAPRTPPPPRPLQVCVQLCRKRVLTSLHSPNGQIKEVATPL